MYNPAFVDVVVAVVGIAVTWMGDLYNQIMRLVIRQRSLSQFAEQELTFAICRMFAAGCANVLRAGG